MLCALVPALAAAAVASADTPVPVSGATTVELKLKLDLRTQEPKGSDTVIEKRKLDQEDLARLCLGAPPSKTQKLVLVVECLPDLAQTVVDLGANAVLLFDEADDSTVADLGSYAAIVSSSNAPQPYPVLTGTIENDMLTEVGRQTLPATFSLSCGDATNGIDLAFSGILELTLGSVPPEPPDTQTLSCVTRATLRTATGVGTLTQDGIAGSVVVERAKLKGKQSSAPATLPAP